jgi:1-acyl-sn-glycerol-3-phosphate acyltransferase
MSNHRSAADIIALGIALKDFQLRFVAKKELLKVPVFGWGLRALGNIIIDRTNHVQAVRSYAVAGQRIRRGISVMVFPEGTRGEGEDLLPFKKGGFVLAIETGTPIAPIIVVNTDAVLPKKSWRIESGEVEVRIGKPIEMAGVTVKDRNRIVRNVREAMDELVRGGAAPSRSESATSSAPARHAENPIVLSAGSARSASISWSSSPTPGRRCGRGGRGRRLRRDVPESR